MNRLASFIVAFSLAAAGSSALANQVNDRASKQAAKPKPAQMTEAQMDKVAGGQGSLIEVTLVDVVDVNNNQVQVFIPVNASVAAAILGEAGSFATQRPGRVIAIQ
jgi:hypothetical protein